MRSSFFLNNYKRRNGIGCGIVGIGVIYLGQNEETAEHNAPAEASHTFANNPPMLASTVVRPCRRKIRIEQLETRS
jgi:hypothetical protein